MKKSILSIIVVLLLTAVVPETKSETLTSNSSQGLIHVLFDQNDNGNALSKRLKKRKMKKAVRKVARVYRDVKPDRESRGKSRKVQRKARRIINIF